MYSDTRDEGRRMTPTEIGRRVESLYRSALNKRNLCDMVAYKEADLEALALKATALEGLVWDMYDVMSEVSEERACDTFRGRMQELNVRRPE